MKQTGNAIALARRDETIAPADRLPVADRLPAAHLTPFAHRVQRTALQREASEAYAILLRDTHNDNTRRSYRNSLCDFFGTTPPRDEDIRLFVSLDPPDIVLVWDDYLNGLIGRGLSHATINSRRAAVGALLKKAHRLGWAKTDGRGLLDGKSVEPGDTRGVESKIFKQIPTAPKRRTHARESKTSELRALRDEAILTVLCRRGLRRAAIVNLKVRDFSYQNKTLTVKLKGKEKPKRLEISQGTADAIARYLLKAGHSDQAEAPLFQNLSRNPRDQGRGITDTCVYKLVREAGALLGVPDLQPHDARRAAITHLSQKTNGNLVDVQEFSGHAKIETVRRYVRNAQGTERRLVNLMDGIFDD
jgi:integrase